MNTGNPTRPMRRMLGVLGEALSGKSCRRFRSFPRELPSLYVLFCWALILSVLLLMVSGCGRYKEELESAKQQIEKLNSDVKRLTEDVARLNQEKSRLGDESKSLADKNARMQRELDDLSKTRATLAAENKEIKQKNSAADQEIASLKSERASLSKEIDELKKRLAESAPPPTSLAPMPTEPGPGSAKQPGELNPCDAVVAYMKASEGIIRQQKGTQRTKSLEQVKQQYAPKMKGAPDKAIKAAEQWVKEGAKLWDESHDEGVFQLLRLRNTVLEACGKSPDDVGFK
jgi:outer membrane murein-binding lipoprotein Lpp